jgi:hypothetical protein
MNRSLQKRKQKIIDEQRLLLIKWEEERPKLSDIDPDIIASLSDNQKSQVEGKLQLMANPDFAVKHVIALTYGKIKLIEIERWKTIIESEYADKFKLIYKKNDNE